MSSRQAGAQTDANVNLDKSGKADQAAKTGGQQGTENTAGPASSAKTTNGSDAMMPHERDETTDDKSKPRPVMKQALNDLQQGKVDTDLHGQRGVEEVVKQAAKK
ncbi:MAG: hypothetical protein V4495_14920 [Pseudomonadota bacterium]